MLANQALAALTGGTPIVDATLTASVTRGTGSAKQTATATLKARGSGQSRIDVSTATQFREIRNDPSVASYFYGADGTWHEMSVHNCWTDAAWFFPALSSLAASASPGVVVSYRGQETLAGTVVNHLRFSRAVTPPVTLSTAYPKLVARLSTVDMYLDATTSLPVAETFNMHPDNDAGKDLPAQITYSDYRKVNGALIPFRVQEYLQGGLWLDVWVTSATANSGLTDSDFIAQ